MDNSTECCSYVSVDYIICECGETFPDEDTLRVHLDNEHAVVKPEHPVALEADIVVNSDENSLMEDGLMVEEEELQEEQQSEYYLEDTSQIPTLQFILPEDIKQENIVVQYMDQNGAYITNIQEVEDTKPIIQTEEPHESQQTIKRVVFKKEQIQEQVVVIAQGNDEHDYDRGVDTSALKQFRYCDVCGKSYITERSLQLHITQSHKDSTQLKRKPKYRNRKNVVCDVCGKKYASNAALRYHVRVHTGERPYKCTECFKTFTMPLFLQLHLRTHTGERPYQCPQCPKAFSNPAALVRHDRVHTGEKPYVCPECGRAFSQSNSMKLHYQTVHLKMPTPYKSAARKMRDENKIVYIQEVSRRRIKTESSSESSIVPQEKLMIRHGKIVPHYDYMQQDVTFVENEEYELHTTT